MEATPIDFDDAAVAYGVNRPAYDSVEVDDEIKHYAGEIDRRRMEAKIEAADRSGKLLDRRWRLNNLYFVRHIKEKYPVQFQMTPEHERLYYYQHVDTQTRRHIMLKSRQVFMTTYGVIRMLDECSLQRNVRCMLSNWSEEEAVRTIQEKAWYISRMSPWLLQQQPVRTKSGVRFPRTNSELFISITGRGHTADNVHITEFGKTSDYYPDKAKEVLDGILEGSEYGHVLIESTSKGSTGPFPEMVRHAHSLMKSGKRLNRIQFMLHFIAWHNKQYNRLLGHHEPEYDDELRKYFSMIEHECEISLDEEQRNWYGHTLTESAQGDWRRMKMERPSTIEEALSADQEGFVMNEFVQRMYDENRVGEYHYEPGKPVVCFWDFGFSDATSVIFVQKDDESGLYTVLDSFEGRGRWLDHYFGEVNRRAFNVAAHVLPWDSESTSTQLKERLVGGKAETIKDYFEEAGYHNLVVLPRIKPKRLGFELSRANSVKVRVASGNGDFLKAIKNVRKAYHSASGNYENELRKGADENHFYDCFELLARTIKARPDLWEPHRTLWVPMSQTDKHAMYRRALC